MDEDTYNWYYGAVEYAFICEEEYQILFAFTEKQQDILHEETSLRYHAEADANRQRRQKWITGGTGLLLGVIGGFIIAN